MYHKENKFNRTSSISKNVHHEVTYNKVMEIRYNSKIYMIDYQAATETIIMKTL